MCLMESGSQKLRKEIEIKNNLGSLNGVSNNYKKIEVEMKMYIRATEGGLEAREVKLVRRKEC